MEQMERGNNLTEGNEDSEEIYVLHLYGLSSFASFPSVKKHPGPVFGYYTPVSRRNQELG